MSADLTISPLLTTPEESGPLSTSLLSQKRMCLRFTWSFSPLVHGYTGLVKGRRDEALFSKSRFHVKINNNIKVYFFRTESHKMTIAFF